MQNACRVLLRLLLITSNNTLEAEVQPWRSRHNVIYFSIISITKSICRSTAFDFHDELVCYLKLCVYLSTMKLSSQKLKFQLSRHGFPYVEEAKKRTSSNKA